MAYDVIKPISATKASKPDSGGANVRSVPVFGVVKNNIDPIKSGRLQVYISDYSGDDPDNSDSWITVSFMSPFFGFVEPTAGDNGYGSFKANPSSYGIWNSPPDIGTTVICIFINGDMNYGFYIGCVPKPEALHMVPAIGASTYVVPNEGEAQSLGGATQLPVVNMNSNNSGLSDNPNFLNEAKPVHSYVAAVMMQQGIIRDPIRGAISSSSQRESPSRVGWGISTPGRPIYKGGFTDDNIVDAASSNNQSQAMQVVSRRGGHSIVLDDGDIVGKDQLVRIRTALGHQILMSDDGQTLMILHSNGQSYIELGKEGTIDMYSTNSVNIRTQGDLNLHADNNVNIHALNTMNIKAKTLNIESEADTTHRIGENYLISTLGKHSHKVGATMVLQSEDEAGFISSGTTYVNGDKVNINTGLPGELPKDVVSIPINALSDTLSDDVKGFVAAPGKLKSITSRAPAHAPWANAGQGVNVKTSLNASDALPARPGSVVDKTNLVASQTTTGDNQVTTPSIAAMPNINPISASLDKNTTSALLCTLQDTAANNPLTASVVLQGAGVVEDAAGTKTAVLGSFAATPTALEIGNIIKPGSALLVNKLVQQNFDVANALPKNLFTGIKGTTDLNSFVNNSDAQVGAQLAVCQKTQTQFTNMGLISGKESPTVIAGLVTSGVLHGVKETTSVINSAYGPSVPTATSLLGVANKVMNSISSGNFAARVADTNLNGIGSIVNATDQLDSVAGSGQGAVAAGFGAIAASFKPLQANVPQVLPQPTGNVDLSRGDASTLASGIINLPGQQTTINPVINQRIPNLGIPEITPQQDLKGLIQGAVSAAISGTYNIDALPKPLLSNLGDISSPTLAALSSIPRGNLSNKLTCVGIDTLDRTGIDGTVSSILGDPGIPAPDFSGTVSPKETAKFNELIKTGIEQRKKGFEELEVLEANAKTLKDNYYAKEQTLPEGDPEIQKAKDAWLAAAKVAKIKADVLNPDPFASSRYTG